MNKLSIALIRQIKKGLTGSVSMGYDEVGDDMVSDICIWTKEITNSETERNHMEDDLYEAGIEIVKIIHSEWVINKSKTFYKTMRLILPKATYELKED